MLVDLCKPALLYFVMSVISLMIIVVSGFPFLYVLIKIAFIAGWTWTLNYICKKGYTVISWVFLIAPFVMMIIMKGFAEGLQRKTAE